MKACALRKLSVTISFDFVAPFANTTQKSSRSPDDNDTSSVGRGSSKGHGGQFGSGRGGHDGEDQELQLFDFDSVKMATNNFSFCNKIGEGGFDIVYKGNLSTRQAIAVKRLSRTSGQGMTEFKNEIMLISKLQHRNLVKLVGVCIEGEEKLLLYEYLSNKSLDKILFDPSKQAELDWTKRFRIIKGVACGLLYLHRDSRLKVIHRDLKASNILLDEHMNPKISDFGMARIFGWKQDLANTNRVVGTYGYMAPEYALEGVFSEKSDVFSFGILLLEIVSGVKNKSFFHDEQHLSLLGYAWQLWNDGKGMQLVDQRVINSCDQLEAMRCIHIGLLCVQDYAVDRPTMYKVVSMLTTETTLTPPKMPLYIRDMTNVSLDSYGSDLNSTNECTITVIESR
ncbi:putative G-type lectin S-receptor-like serine/threonine-protein kinase At1g61610 [Macadamia integrifolia]|uniref:putative G-type lectin S-receptor-like serine/threonine-protein kinase At1g61610 n=1 Tax=Macadamia integrifolia TaxID=60698 RepID=UPI001C4EDE1E|nr:putative G-type lectin S-receptor-like serine/threonine-protein kinase At1g61610 [Macadamia integrifolia]